MRNPRRSSKLLICLGWACSMVLPGCGKTGITDQDEVAQVAGDMMASVDESSGSTTGTYSFDWPGSNPLLRPGMTAQYASLGERAWNQLIRDASAATCGTVSEFSSCSSGAITRTFGGSNGSCTIGFATVTGTVALSWSGNGDCTLDVGETVSRAPNFSITGRRGATLAVSATGSQQVERTGASAFLFRNTGIKRKMTKSSGDVLFDLDFVTTSDIAITGTSRSNRVMDGGALKITNTIKNYEVTLAPHSLTWTSTCNCASSGSLTGSVTGDETATEFTIEITGCGTATVTADGESEAVTFDRCIGL